MNRGFTIKETKNCRKYTKHVYELSQAIDESFVESFSVFGQPEITNFSKFLPDSHDMIKIRSYDYCFEIAGSLEGNDLMVTYEKYDDRIVGLVEGELNEWIDRR